jgi:GntR family transcriptional regulator
MQIQVDKTSGVPIHDQIKEQITGLIHAGQLRTGDQLPTIRALAIDLAVNVNTVALAYRELDGEGVIATRRGEGTFVTQAPGAAELKRLRQKKLRDVVQNLIEETRRLGYSPDEVQQAIAEQIAKWA